MFIAPLLKVRPGRNGKELSNASLPLKRWRMPFPAVIYLCTTYVSNCGSQLTKHARTSSSRIEPSPSLVDTNNSTSTHPLMLSHPILYHPLHTHTHTHTHTQSYILSRIHTFSHYDRTHKHTHNHSFTQELLSQATPFPLVWTDKSLLCEFKNIRCYLCWAQIATLAITQESNTFQGMMWLAFQTLQQFCWWGAVVES